MRLRHSGNIIRIYIMRRRRTSRIGLESVLDGLRILNLVQIGRSLETGLWMIMNKWKLYSKKRLAK